MKVYYTKYTHKAKRADLLRSKGDSVIDTAGSRISRRYWRYETDIAEYRIRIPYKCLATGGIDISMSSNLRRILESLDQP